MIVEYSTKFVKDLKALHGTPSFIKIRELSFDIIPALQSLAEIPHFSKLEGYDNYYRLRVGDYRIGVKIEGEVLIFMRVLHRKEIYRYFP